MGVALQHGSRILRILARVSHPGCGCRQPLPRRVCACCDAQCCRQKRHVHCGPTNPTLSDSHIAAWWRFLLITAFVRCACATGLWGPFFRSLLCAVCTSETTFFGASMQAHCFRYFSFCSFRIMFWTDLRAVEGQRDYILAGAPSK